LYNGTSSCFDDPTCPQLVDGKHGKALDFDGVDDYVEVADDPSLNFGVSESFSLEAWFKLSSLPSTSLYAILSKYGAGQGAGFNDLYSLLVETTGEISFRLRDSAGNNPIITGSTLTANVWYHVFAVRDIEKNEIRLYLNGISDATPVTDTTVDDISPPRPLLIGNQEHYIAGESPILPFHGVIDEVRIYNRALSAEEIQQHYQDGINLRFILDNPGQVNFEDQFKLATTIGNITNITDIILDSNLTAGSVKRIVWANMTYGGQLDWIKISSPNICPAVYAEVKDIEGIVC
jgi:hypothetical protein